MYKTKPILKEPARERKHQDGVANQLARRAPKKSEIVAHCVPETVNVDETVKELKAKSKTAKSPPAKPEVTKRMLSKVARAYRKAGIKGGGTESDHTAFVHTLLNAGIPILERSSSRIARAIKSEIEIADLKSTGAAPRRKLGRKRQRPNTSPSSRFRRVP
jgi:Xaa-Pro aminopeptidase